MTETPRDEPPPSIVFAAARVPGTSEPHDTVHVAVQLGEPRRPIRPVVVLAGFDDSPAATAWLQRELAAADLAPVTVSFPAALPGGHVRQNPGFGPADPERPERGLAANGSVLGVVVDCLRVLAAEPATAGRLDASVVGLVGVGRGGDVAISASDGRIPGLGGAVAIDGTTIPIGGHGPGTGIPHHVTPKIPLLVINTSPPREPEAAPDADPVRRTWTDAIPPGSGARYAELSGSSEDLLRRTALDAAELGAQRALAVLTTLHLRNSVGEVRHAGSQLTAILRNPLPGISALAER